MVVGADHDVARSAQASPLVLLLGHETLLDRVDVTRQFLVLGKPSVAETEWPNTVSAGATWEAGAVRSGLARLDAGLPLAAPLDAGLESRLRLLALGCLALGFLAIFLLF